MSTSTIVEKIQELKKLETNATALRAAIETERVKELAALPVKYGYENLAAFVKALKDAAGKGGKAAKAGKSGKPAKAKAAKSSGKRGRASRADVAQLKAAILDGQSCAEVKRQFGISAPYYYALRSKLKKAAGHAQPSAEASAAA